jgi:ubiquinone/menaquinone biosynthesis C-methylase UbiE
MAPRMKSGESEKNKRHMTHIFEFSKMKMLDTPERRKMLPPEPILRKLGLREGMTMADVGCGIGYFSFPAAAIVGSHGFVWGIDVQQEFVDYCNDKARTDRVANATFLKGAHASVPINDATVDACLLSLVLHEVEDGQKEAYLKELANTLKPGGAIWIIEWKKERSVMGAPFEERLSADDLLMIAASVGLRVDEIFDVSPSHYAAILKK